MNDISKSGDIRMTVREVSEALGVSERTIQRHAEALGLTEDGKTTYINEVQATAIKHRIGTGRNDLANVVEVRNIETDLEMLLLDKRIQQWKDARIASLQAEVAAAAPKVESFNALQRSEHTMSLTECAKHFDLHVKTQVYPYLRAMKYLNLDDTPSQSAIDAGYLAIRQTRCHDGEYRPQAVVLACQLETWRTRVVPQIAAWMIKE
jgi:phage antirepressor YoqD-like protein